MIQKLMSFFLLALVIGFYQPEKTYGGSSPLEKLLEQNDKIKALAKYKDSEEVIKLKLENLDEINESRRVYGLGPVKLDILASRVANLHCVEMLKYNYMGHWNKKGYKPYHRYAFAGGRDHVSENLYMKMTTSSFDQSSESVLDLMAEGHGLFMAEIAPNDGHKKQVLRREHTHVGIGYAINNKGFRYAQEFVDRYVKLKPVARKVSVGDTIILKGKMLRRVRKKYGPYALIIYYEPVPRQFNYKRQPGSYGDFTNSRYLMVPPWKIKYNRNKNTFKIKIKFKNARKGLYYIQLYIRDNVKTIPYKPRGRVSMNTQNAISVTGLVIEVK